MPEINYLMQKWASREMEQTFRQALRIQAALYADHPERIVNDAIDALSRNLAGNATKHGYKIDMETVRLMSREFDFGHKTGLSASARFIKDPNASAILFISEHYEKALAIERARVLALENTWWRRALRVLRRAVRRG